MTGVMGWDIVSCRLSRPFNGLLHDRGDMAKTGDSKLVDAPLVVFTADKQERALNYKFAGMCPWGHDEPDRYWVSVTWTGLRCIETQSFADYLDGYADVEASAEEIAREIYARVYEVLGDSGMDTLEVNLSQENQADVHYQVTETGADYER